MKRLLATILLLSLCLTGCSKSGPDAPVKTTWNDGVIKINGKEMNENLIKYSGYTAYIDVMGVETELIIEVCDDPSLSQYNRETVALDLMTKVKSNGYGVSLYQDTEYRFWYEAGEDTYYAVPEADNPGDVGVVFNMLHDICKDITLTNGSQTVKINGVLTLKPSYDGEIINVTKDYVSITNTLKISTDQSVACTNPVQVQLDGKTVDMLMTTQGNFDYYQYEGLTIQCISGMFLDDYIDLK